MTVAVKIVRAVVAAAVAAAKARPLWRLGAIERNYW
jgi:hypothetical protein